MPIFGNQGQRGGGGGARWIIAIVIALIGVVGYFMKEKVTNPETGESYRRSGSGGVDGPGEGPVVGVARSLAYLRSLETSPV